MLEFEPTTWRFVKFYKAVITRKIFTKVQFFSEKKVDFCSFRYKIFKNIA